MVGKIGDNSNIPQEHTVHGAPLAKGSLGSTPISQELKGGAAKSAHKATGRWEAFKESCQQLSHDFKMFLNRCMSKYPFHWWHTPFIFTVLSNMNPIQLMHTTIMW